jgi:hypothetical protein
LRAKCLPEDETTSVPVLLAALERLEAILSAASPDDIASASVTTGITRLQTRLQALSSKGIGVRGTAADATIVERLQSADDDELFNLIDQKIGRNGVHDDE